MLQLCQPLYSIANAHLLTGRRACTIRASARRLTLYHPSPYSTACSAQRKPFTATGNALPSVIMACLIGVVRRCHASYRAAAPPPPTLSMPLVVVTTPACSSTAGWGLRHAWALCPLGILCLPLGQLSGVGLQTIGPPATAIGLHSHDVFSSSHTRVRASCARSIRARHER